MSAGRTLEHLVVDETATQDDADHIVCCMDDDAALCGVDLADVPWLPAGVEPDCGVCKRIDDDLDERTDAAGGDCVGCWRALFGGPA